MAEQVLYLRVARAEQAIIDAGYTRSGQRSLWINANGKTAKVMRTEGNKFYVQWS